jgi:hypothetical protein
MKYYIIHFICFCKLINIFVLLLISTNLGYTFPNIKIIKQIHQTI